MEEPPMSPPVIEAHELTKRYGTTVAVDRLSFTVQPGRVTGFLGPNGAGKSTTMRLLLGLDRPDSGHATVAGRPYRELVRPLTVVGALLEAKAVHPGRSARDHLLWLAQSQGLPKRRVGEVLELVGLGGAAGRRARALSLGMSQRLGIAAALLGDPRVLLLDEPVNGLDPEGVLWIRTLMRELAAEGRTVVVSSHLLHEMAVTADHLIVIGRGRLLADCPAAELTDLASGAGRRSLLVRTPEPARLAELAGAAGATVAPDEGGALVVSGLDAPGLAGLAARAGVALYELTPRTPTLEAAFLHLTSGSTEYTARSPR
jgi:ABC-2 type transport system ATP-binding protein